MVRAGREKGDIWGIPEEGINILLEKAADEKRIAGVLRPDRRSTHEGTKETGRRCDAAARV